MMSIIWAHQSRILVRSGLLLPCPLKAIRVRCLNEPKAGATNSHYVWLRRIDLPIRFAKFVGNMLPGKCAEVRRVS